MYDQTRAQQPADQSRRPAERRGRGPEPLIPAAERDKTAVRLGHALNIFDESPLQSLEEAESAYDEATAHLVAALAERRRVLRAAWEEQNPEASSAEFRIALRQYRELTQRVLHL